MVLRRKKEQLYSPVKNKNDRDLCLRPEHIAEGWDYIIPENLKLSEDRQYNYREVKAYALLGPETMKLAQMLIVIFDYGDENVAKEAYKEIGVGLESEMPKSPGVGDESVLYELDMKPMVNMKIAAVRKGGWLVIYTLWMFQDFMLEDQWLKEMLQKQLRRIGI